MKKIIKCMAMAMTFIVLFSCVDTSMVYAGHSRVSVDSSSFSKGINTAVWSNPEGDVIAKKGVLSFTKNSTKYTRLITKSMVERAESGEKFANVSLGLLLKKMPNKGEFILGFGLGSVESFSKSAGQIEIVFLNENGVKLEVRNYNEVGEEKVLIKRKDIGILFGSQADIDVVINSNQKMTIKVNGREVVSEKIPFLPEGSVGFFQTGSCEVDIPKLSISSYKYDSPENCNFIERFDDDSYNVNTIFTKVTRSNYVPCTMSVEEYDDDFVMYYENSGAAQISTLYQYSNFELTFDVPYLLRKNIEDENENIISEKSMWIGVSFGDEMIESSDNGYIYSPEMLLFDRDSVVKSLAQGSAPVAQSEKYPFFAEDETRGFSVKVSVVDAHVKIGMKWLNEEAYTTIGEYDTIDGQTPLGYVHIWTCGPATFAIDNIEMTNLDAKPNLIEVDYKTSKFEIPEDYVYVKPELVFREETEKRFNWYIIIPCAAVAGILIVGITAVITRKRRKENAK